MGNRARRPSGDCQICGVWRQSLHREHIIPKFKGGTEDESNIQWICANCHEDKTRLDLQGMPGANSGKTFSAKSRAKMRQSALQRIERDGGTPLPPSKGVNNPHAKLTENQVLDIRTRYAAGGITQKELGKEYGVHNSTISFIVRGKLWND